MERYGVDINKIHVIPEAVDTKLFNPTAKPLKVKGLAKYNFLSIFKWERRKGWDVLLRAYPVFIPSFFLELFTKVCECAVNHGEGERAREAQFF
jgi:hypothetical protein